MTVPSFPSASTPIADVLVDGVDQTSVLPLAATVMPIASVGAPVTATVTDWLADPPAPVQVMP
jgi:hypothetical protein